MKTLHCAVLVAVGLSLAACSTFTRDVDSLGVQGGATYDPVTGACGGNVGTTIHFRDPRDSKKVVRPISA